MKYNPRLDATYEYYKTRIDIGACHEHASIHKQNNIRIYYKGR